LAERQHYEYMVMPAELGPGNWSSRKLFTDCRRRLFTKCVWGGSRKPPILWFV